MKMQFAVACKSRIVDGITILEVEVEPLDTKALDNVVKYAKMVFPHIAESEITSRVDDMIELNNRMFISKLMVPVSDNDIENDINCVVQDYYDKHLNS